MNGSILTRKKRKRALFRTKNIKVYAKCKNTVPMRESVDHFNPKTQHKVTLCITLGESSAPPFLRQLSPVGDELLAVLLDDVVVVVHHDGERLGGDSIENFQLEFWLQKSLEFWHSA